MWCVGYDTDKVSNAVARANSKRKGYKLLDKHSFLRTIFYSFYIVI